MTRIFKTPDLGTGASGWGFPGVGVVDLEIAADSAGVLFCEDRDESRFEDDSLSSEHYQLRTKGADKRVTHSCLASRT